LPIFIACFLLESKNIRMRAFTTFITILTLLFFNNLLFSQSERASSVSDFTITLTFAVPPENPVVFKAPLKYNKDFALVLQMDNGNVAIHNQVMPYFKGQNGNPGLFMSDGAQGNVPFKMDAVHYSFDEEGVGVHDNQTGFLSWSNLETIWAAEFGINSQGLNKIPTSDTRLEVLRNISYTRRRTSETIIASGADMNIHVVPGTATDQIALAKQHSLAVYHQGASAFANPALVENLPPIQGIELRRSAITSNLFSQVQQVASISGPNNHYITTFYNSGFNSPDISFDAFKAQMDQIASVFGRNGTDKIWSSSATEVFEYLRIKELVTVNSSINGNTLQLTFSGNNIPDDFRYYALTIVVEGESIITDMQVQQPDGLSTYTRNGTKALINMRWNGKAEVDDFVRAESFVVVAEQSPTQANGIVAMDYVKMLPEGAQKEQLRQRLCALPDIIYEPGFCPLSDFLGGDRAICLGDTVNLEGPEAQSYLWSTGSTSQSIELIPEESLEVWLRVTVQGNISYTDTIDITVNPLPVIVIEPESATIGPGDEIALSASGSVSYLWSEGSETATIVVSPYETTAYSVIGTDENGCKASAEVLVEVVYINEIDFTYNTVCFGDTTFLNAIINSNDSILAKEWDIDGDGLFGELSGDSAKILFEIPGEKLIGFRIKTISGAVVIKYHAVVVADYPVIDFSYEGRCVGQVTVFTDRTSLIVGTITEWNWNFGDENFSTEKNPQNFYQNVGTYELTLSVESSYGCRMELADNITISTPVEPDIRQGDGTAIVENEVLKLVEGESLLVVAAGVYDSAIWVATIKGAQYTITAPGNYYVDVYKDGCSGRRSFRVVLDDKPQPPTDFIMNLITPNSDGYNDYWLIGSVETPMQVTIYNRLGNQVYESKDYQNDWDGTYNGNPLPEGTYYYVIVGNDRLVYKGPISILY